MLYTKVSLAELQADSRRHLHPRPLRSAVTLRVYGHLFEGTQAELSRRLDDLRASTAPNASNAIVTLPPTTYVRGHEKVLACGHLEVLADGQQEFPAGGHVEVLTPR